MTKYSCQFAPDGKHFIEDKKLKIDNAWEWLLKARSYKLLNKFAKIRIVNLETKAIIGDR